MSITTSSKVSAADRELRARTLVDAEHSSAMEGLEASPEFRADAAAYVEGEIDVDELGRRTRARYGIV
jgi:hypothetical protein